MFLQTTDLTFWP